MLFSENTEHLPRLVALAGSCGATLHLQNPTLIRGLDEPEEGPLTPLSELGSEAKQAAFQVIVEAFKLAKALKVQLTADPMLEAQFDARMEDEIEAVKHEFDDPNATRPLELVNITTRSKGGQTRLCLEPWNYLLFAQNGDVFSCCVGYPAVAKLGEDTDLEAIYNSPGNRRVREELLTGNLRSECATCPRKANVSTTELRAKVSEYLESVAAKAAGVGAIKRGA